jgi:hypothetical protein
MALNDIYFACVIGPFFAFTLWAAMNKADYVPSLNRSIGLTDPGLKSCLITFSSSVWTIEYTRIFTQL